jgi:hypothetical protein
MSVDDMFQQAYVFALEEMPKYSVERGTLYQFLRSLLHNKFFNLKRDNWERHTPPCKKCPLDAYIPDTNSCRLFECKSNCKVWADWKKFNSSKKSLAGCANSEGVKNIAKYSTNWKADQEMVDKVDRYIRVPQDRAIWLRFISGHKLYGDEAAVLIEIVDRAFDEAG